MESLLSLVLAALALPRVLDRLTESTVMMTGTAVLVASSAPAFTLNAAGILT